MTVCATASSLTFIAGTLAASMLLNLIATVWVWRGERRASHHTENVG